MKIKNNDLKLVFGLSLLFLMIFFISACSDKLQNKEKAGGHPVKGEKSDNSDNGKDIRVHKYLSIINTHGTDKEDEYVSDILSFDIEQKELSKIASLPYTSQYPLAVYEKSTDQVYYSGLSGDGKGDELYCYDCQTKKSRQLTASFFAINNIYILDDTIFLTAVKRKTGYNVELWKYDKKSELVENIFLENDFNIRCANYNPDLRSVCLAGFIESDHEKAWEKEVDGKVSGINNSIYLISNNSSKKVYSKKSCYIDSIVEQESSNSIIFGWRPYEGHGSSEYIKISEDDSTLSELTVDIKKLGSNDIDGLVYSDKDSLYFIRCIDKNGDSIDQLCQYHYNDTDIEVLYEAPPNSSINNAQMMMY